MSFTLRTTCRLCDHPLGDKRVLDLGNVPLANEIWSDHPALEQEAFPLYVVQCSACQHLQTPVVVDPKRLFSADYAYRSGNAGDFKAHIEDLAKSLEECDAGYQHYDIGSNDGTLVRALRRLGVSAVGIDPARDLAADASQSGALTIPAFLTVEVAQNLATCVGRGIVTALNVFAHADDLAELAAAIRILCGFRGYAIIEVADVSNVIRTGDVSTVYHEHLSHWHLRPMVTFLAKHGLTVTHAERVAAQGGSIRVHASQTGSRHSTPIPEEALAQFDPPPASEWQARADRNTAALKEKLLPYMPRNDGGSEVGESIPTPRLAVFGAPARLTALAYSLGLKREDVICVFDDEPRKVGKFTPGLHWPIVSSAELMKRNPPAILVASWNYFDHIRARFPDYRGEWIVPNREAT